MSSIIDPQQSFGVYLGALNHLFQLNRNFEIHQEFIEPAVNYLNKLFKNQERNEKIGNITERLYQIEYVYGDFKNRKAMNDDEYKQKKDILYCLIAFEKQMHSIQVSNINATQNSQKLMKIIKSHEFLVFQRSFDGNLAIDYFDPKQLLDALAGLSINLLKPISNSKQSLLEYILISKRDLSESYGEAFKNMLGNKGITGEETTSKQKTIAELFQNRFKMPLVKQPKISILPQLFQSFVHKNQKLKDLKFSKKDQITLINLVKSSDFVFEEFTCDGQKVIVQINNQQVNLKTNKETKHIRLCFPPEKNVKVDWKVFIDSAMKLVTLSEQDNNTINQAFRMAITDLIQIKVEEQKLEVKINFDRMLLLTAEGDAYGALLWIPTYKKQIKLLQTAIIYDQQIDEYQNQKVQAKVSLPRKEQRSFSALGYLQQFFPTIIDKKSYNLNKMNVVCEKEAICKMFDDFINNGLRQKFQSYLQKEGQIFSASLGSHSKDERVVKLINRFAQSNKLCVELKAEYNKNKQKYQIGSFKNHKDYKNFIEKFILYIYFKENTQIQKQMIKVDDEKIEIIEGLEQIMPIKAEKINSNKVSLEGENKDVEIVKDILNKQRISVQIDMLKQLLFLQKQENCYLKNFKHNGGIINKLGDPVIQVQCDSKYFGELLKKLSAAKENLNDIARNQQIAKIKQFARIQFFKKFQILKNFDNVKVNLIATNQRKVAEIEITYPKHIEKIIVNELQRIKKQISNQSISFTKFQSSRFILKNIGTDISLSICSALKQSLQNFKRTAAWKPQSSFESKVTSSVQLQIQNDGSIFTLTNGTQLILKKFEDDCQLVKIYVEQYQKQLKKFSGDSMQKFIKYLMSSLRVSEQKTTQQKTIAGNIKRYYLQKVTKIVWAINQRKLKQLNFTILNHFEKSFGKELKLAAFQQFSNECIKNSKIKIFHSYLQENIDKFADQSKKSSHLVQKYKQQILESMIIIEDKLQAIFQKGKQQIDIEDLITFHRSVEIQSSIFFNIDLPIVEHLATFKQKFEQSRLMIVKTGTGSGKSTVLPPYILGLGCKKIYVTQPRRLPCQRICQRIAKTNGNGVVGFRLGGGVSINADNDLIYITDGLLKQIIYQNEDFLKNVGCIILDEVHQQTKNIDLIILLLSKLMDKYPQLKVILCSATVNENLIKLFDSKYKVQTFEVKISSYPVTEHAITNISILHKVHQLSATLIGGEQMLVFFPSVAEVEQYKKIFNQTYKKNAHSLFGTQKPKVQQEAMKDGLIIFSTSVAETSLTFEKLKIVVDSQKTRIQIYDTKQKMTVSKEIPSSKSSIKQRKGRLGRVQPGDYYYMQYNDDNKSSEHDLSQLDRTELLNVCFQLFVKYQNWNDVEQQLNRLHVQNPKEFKQKLNQARDTLGQFGGLFFQGASYKMSNICKTEIKIFGNLGNIFYNIALYYSTIQKCYQNMAAIISFSMVGVNIYEYIRNKYQGNKSNCSGDLEVAGKFILDVANKMSLSSIKAKDVRLAFYKLPNIKEYENIGSLLLRILIQLKRFMDLKPQFMTFTNNWSIPISIIAKTFTNNLYFNRSLIGGNKIYFQKIVPDMIYHPNQSIQIVNDVQFQMNKNSILYADAENTLFIVSLSNMINPYSACTLSMCSKIDQKIIQSRVSLELKEHNEKIGKFDIMKEQNIYGPIIGHHGTLNIAKNGDLVNIKGSFYQVMKRYKELKQVLFIQWKTDITAWLNDAIADRQQANNGKRFILPKVIIQNFEKLNLFYLFRSLTYEFKNLFNVEIRWRDKGKVEIKKASNFAISIFAKRIKGFLDWFVQSQIIITEDLKQYPQQPTYKPEYFNNNKLKHFEILKRINEIVDPTIDFSILKSWVNGVYDNVHIHVYRMIAVCWVLVNTYGCTIKGGFVRDWVVNGDVKLPGGPLNNLLVPDNHFYRICNDEFSPSDIDADLSSEYPFDYEGFVKTMNKLGIKVSAMKDDGWRYLLAFDLGEVTGGFTADLIHPYCYISHDKCDFDVNMMYIKGGHLNQIGMKIPLKLRVMKPNNAKTQEFETKIQQLIFRCNEKKMRKIITSLDNYRIGKFQNRGWSIEDEVYEPVVHRSLKTSYHSLTKQQLRKFDPHWYQQMVTVKKYTILEACLIKSTSFEAAYDSAKCWIAREAKNFNERTLYHGCSEDAAKSIADIGFDERYFGATGQVFGRGVYFADDPKYSDSYVKPDNNGGRWMLICQVALGNQEPMTAANDKKMGAAKGYHSVKVTARAPNMEYICNRLGQARPMVIVKYRP